MERSKVRPADNIRCFFLSRFFLEYFLLLRGQCAAKNGNKVPAEEGLELGLVGELAELESVRWIVMRMRYSMEDKVRYLPHISGTTLADGQPPAWKELQASMECFTQIVRHPALRPLGFLADAD
jgi:replication fork protection complex subunit Tof1/Swi1